MNKIEFPRQLVHLSGLLFVGLAQFLGAILVSLYSFFIALTFLIYSEHIRREARRLGLIDKLELKFRNFVKKFERKQARPFMGAFWFYIGFGVTFLLFPFKIASAACAMLAVGDALSTLIGVKYGKHKILGNKSLEGSTIFFISSFLIALLFVSPLLAFFGSIIATLTEFASQIKLKNIKLDDNLTIPIFSGFVMLIFSIIL